MVAIVVEDGTGLPNANSYQSVAEVTAFALDWGITLPVDPDVVGSYLIQAAFWIQAKESEFVGTRAHEGQSLAFPRATNPCDFTQLDPDVVPAAVIQVQAFLVIMLTQGKAIDPAFTLFPVVTGSDLVIEEQVDKIRVKYAEAASAILLEGPYSGLVSGLLKPLTLEYGGAQCLSVVRG